MSWTRGIPTTEGWTDELTDGALETRLRLYVHHLQALSRRELIDVILAERRHRVLDRRQFLAMLMQHDVALHAVPPDEWGGGMEDAEPDPLDEDELTTLLGRAPDAQEVDDYLRHLEATASGPSEEDLIDWALDMPDC